MSGFGMPVQKAKNFKGTLAATARLLRPYPVRSSSCGGRVLSTLFNVGRPEESWATPRRSSSGLRSPGPAAVQGAGIDFTALGRILLELVGLYLVSALFQYVSST